MTDKEIIQGLIDRDNHITDQFFNVRCRPLLISVMRLVFNYPVEYDEMVAELYDYLMADDSARLRQFQFRSSIYQWIKVVAIRYFIQKRDSMIDDNSKEPPYDRGDDHPMDDSSAKVALRLDIAKMLSLMDNQRYADVLRHLILQDEEPSNYAREIGVTVENLYNIKKRAITAFSQIAIKYYSYGR